MELETSRNLGDFYVRRFAEGRPINPEILAGMVEDYYHIPEVPPPPPWRPGVPPPASRERDAPQGREPTATASGQNTNVELAERSIPLIKNFQKYLNTVETFLKGTADKSTQTEAEKPGPEHGNVDRLREHPLPLGKAPERTKNTLLENLQQQLNQLNQFDLEAAKKDLSTKRASAEKKKSVDESTQTETHAESSQQLRGRSTSTTRLSGLKHAQGGAARSPSRDSKQSQR